MQEFGDKSFQSEPIGDFQGAQDSSNDLMHKMLRSIKSKAAKKTAKTSEQISDKAKSSVSSRDAKLHYLYNEVRKNGDEKAHLALQAELENRIKVDKVFSSVFEVSNDVESMVPQQYDCLRFMMSVFEEACGHFDDYSLKHVKYLANHCETATPEEINATAEKLISACHQ